MNTAKIKQIFGESLSLKGGHTWATADGINITWVTTTNGSTRHEVFIECTTCGAYAHTNKYYAKATLETVRHEYH